MKRPEDSPFACFGPANAVLGNDPNFLSEPQLRPYKPRDESLAGPLSWRADESVVSPSGGRDGPELWIYVTIAMCQLGRALIAALLLWFAADPAAASAREAAVELGEAPTVAAARSQAPEEWIDRAQRGDGAAAQHLCEFYFDGRSGTFDPAAAVTWCRRAADVGDAGAMQRLGLLTLAGLGVRKDVDAAARLCTQRQSSDPAVSAGFCLAAVAAEIRRDGGSATSVDASGVPRTGPGFNPDAAAAQSVGEWRGLAERGDRIAAARLCAFYFGAYGGGLDPVDAAGWCRRATRYGDASAMRRLGMMRLWGVGMEKDSPQAEALCVAAQSRDPAVSASFCVAAVRQELALAAAETAPSHFAHPAPTPELPDRGTSANTLAHDNAAGSIRTTATGLHFSCRDIIKWSRYETAAGLGVLTPETRAFGRLIIEYQERDYTALDRAAANCAAAIAPYDKDGSDRRHLAEFRTMLPLMKARQRDLDQQRQSHRTDVGRCVEALRRARTIAGQRTPDAGQTHPDSAAIFSCTSAGDLLPVIAKTAPPSAQPRRPAAAGP